MRVSQHRQKSAFSLLEMAIVLSVLGLVAGGIIAGKKLIYASNLHSVLDDALNYSMSMQQFKDKYGEYPGDFSQAINTWGASVAGNGNGNDKIDTDAESYLAWQHLAVAGMIKGTYTGVAGAAAVPTSNIPAGSLANSGYWFGAWGYQAADSIQFYDGDYTNAFLFGESMPASWASNPVLKAADAYQLDVKSDDGLPALGNIRSFNRNLLPNCVDDAGDPPTSISASYEATTTGAACIMVFMNTFKAASKF